MTNEQLALELIKWIVIILAMILLHRSVPSALIDKGVKLAEQGAAKSETPIDDIAVEVFKKVRELLQAEQAPTVTTTTDVNGTTTTVAAPPYIDPATINTQTVG